MANNEIELTETLLDAIASTYHTISQASREEGIPYRRLRAALIKNGNFIPKSRCKFPDPPQLLDMFRKSPHYYSVAEALHVDRDHLIHHCAKVGIEAAVIEIMADAKRGRYLAIKRKRRSYACRYRKKGNK